MDHDDQQIKAAMKEAIKEWLDDRYAAFGKWTIWGLLSALFIMWVKMVLASWYVSTFLPKGH